MTTKIIRYGEILSMDKHSFEQLGLFDNPNYVPLKEYSMRLTHKFLWKRIFNAHSTRMVEFSYLGIKDTITAKVILRH